MPETKIQVSLVTPEKSIFKGETDFVLVPAASGAMGFLPGHMPIVASLSIGIVKIGKGDNARYFGIKMGYVECLFNKVSILTNRAIETEYEKQDQTIKELKEKYRIQQKVTEETKKVAQAIAQIKDLKN